MNSSWVVASSLSAVAKAARPWSIIRETLPALNADVAFVTSLLNVTEAAKEVGINVITNRKHSDAMIFIG